MRIDTILVAVARDENGWRVRAATQDRESDAMRRIPPGAPKLTLSEKIL